jgi:serine/threonine protein phosphatase PrpC
MPNPADDVQKTEGPPTEPIVIPRRVSLDVAALSHQGKVRDANEDAFAVFRMGRYLERVASSVPEADLPSRHEDGACIMILADGLGGHEAGDVASRTALITSFELILRSPRWALKLDDPVTRNAEIRELLARAQGYLHGLHAELRRLAAGDPRLAGMGTTFIGAYSVATDLFVMHVGDSKAYLIREGAMNKITHDHTVAQEYADRGMIPQEEVASHRMQHVLTRAVGGPDENLEGDTHHLRIVHGDRLLLCSDGLTDMVDEQEIRAALAAHPASDAACRALVDLALERGGRDNVTVIVAGFAVE